MDHIHPPIVVLAVPELISSFTQQPIPAHGVMGRVSEGGKLRRIRLERSDNVGSQCSVQMLNIIKHDLIYQRNLR